MKIAAAEFKAKCLALIDRVRERGEPIRITKRGRVGARRGPADDENDRPWERVRGKVRWIGDPFRPAVDESEIDALKYAAARYACLDLVDRSGSQTRSTNHRRPRLPTAGSAPFSV
jgi:antitoxin (DNA-binding transcriptional repressor) of toxin-antitoxin stability system